jgi:hypothetical protein
MASESGRPTARLGPKGNAVQASTGPLGGKSRWGSGLRAGRQQPAERAVAGERVAACAGDEHGCAVKAIHQQCPQCLTCLRCLTTEYSLLNNAENIMQDLKQVQPVANEHGHVTSLIGLDSHGSVYYGKLTDTGRGSFKVTWTRVEEN